MKKKLILNRAYLSIICASLYFLLFISMVSMKIVSYRTPIGGVYAYLSFWGLYLLYFITTNLSDMNFFALVRSKSINQYVIDRCKLLLLDNLIFTIIFTLTIYSYYYFALDLILIDTVMLFAFTIFLLTSFLGYLLTCCLVFLGSKRTILIAILFICLCQIPDIAFFFSVRLGLSDNFYIKPLVLLYNASNNILEDIQVIGVWSVIVTTIFAILKKSRKQVHIK